MILLGMTGPIGHGKTSFASALTSIEPRTRHFETFEVIAEVIDSLHQSLKGPIPAKDDLASINTWLAQLPTILSHNLDQHITFEQIKLTPETVAANPIEYEKLFQHLELLYANPGLTREPITVANKSAFRPILQWLGGYLVAKVDPGIWWREIIHRMQRAANDGATVCVAGSLRYPNEAKLFQAAGGKVIKIYRPNLAENDRADPTERERGGIQPDVTILNNGSLADLAHTARRLLGDLRAKSLKNTYSTGEDSNSPKAEGVS